MEGGPELDRKIEVYWDSEQKWFRGVAKKMTDDGRHIVYYDDNDKKRDNLSGQATKGRRRQWRYVKSSGKRKAMPPSDNPLSNQAKRYEEYVT